MKPKTYLITGATGDTGSKAVRLLVEKGHTVKAFVHKRDGRSAKLAEIGAEVVGDLLDFAAVRAALDRVDGAYFVCPTRWDAIQVAYFTSAAIWNYLTQPFGFAYPGVEAHEIDPWTEDGQKWRRLAVSFPTSNANHNANQVFYYDERFMQRRMDYAPEVTDNAPIAHYTHDPKTFDGFVFPTRRLVHLRDALGKATQGFAGITLKIYSVKIE